MAAPAGSPRPAALVAVGATTLAFSIVYQVIGAQLIMDDWWTLRNARFDGVLATAGTDQWYARPGAGALYALLFGGVGAHPAVYVLILAVLNAASAVLFLRLAQRFFGPTVAIVATFVWIIVPNHLALEVWGSAINIVVSQVLALGALLLLSRAPVRGWRLAVALVLLVAGCLCYEALVPLAGLAVIALPWIVMRRFDPLPTIAGVVAVGAAGVWQLVHVNPAKKIGGFEGDPFVVLPANLGWGVTSFGVVSDLLFALALAGVIVALVRLAMPSLRPRTGVGEWAVLVGVIIMFVGTLAFVRYGFEPVGGGDRENYIAAFGGALVWGGFAEILVRLQVPRVALGVAAAVFLCLTLPTRFARLQLWHDAGTDGVAIASNVVRTYPQPPPMIVVGPRVVYGNLTAYFENTMLEAAVQLQYGRDDVHVRLADTPADFDAAPPDERYDIDGTRLAQRAREVAGAS
jgi:hypothetical protein